MRLVLPLFFAGCTPIPKDTHDPAPGGSTHDTDAVPPDETGGPPGALTIVTRSPEPGDADVWIGEPITVEFSLPLDPQRLAGAVTLDGPDGPLVFEAAVVGETTLSIVLESRIALPADVTLTIGATLQSTGGQAFAGDTWSWTLPVWHALPGADLAADDTAPILAAADDGTLYGAWAADDGTTGVAKLAADTWEPVGASIPGTHALRLVVASADPVRMWADGGDTHVERWDGTAWTALGDLSDVDGLDLAVDADGNPAVAGHGSGGVVVRRWTGAAWEAVGDAVAGAPTSVGLAFDGEVAVLALPDGLYRLEGSWILVQPLAAGPAGAVDLAVSGGSVAVGWDAPAGHVYGGSGESAVDLNLLDPAHGASIATDGETLFLAWAEEGSAARVYVARSAGERWEFLDSAANADGAGPIALPSVAMHAIGEPSVLWNAGGRLGGARWNGSPVLRAGIPTRLPAGACAIPAAAPPVDLAGTNCYADVAAHTLAPQVVPFSLQSALWSDGAFKRRFLLLPDGSTMTWAETGPLVLPVGTLLIKEFWLEREAGVPSTRFPVETRFLAKRCEEDDCDAPWEGYSYQWNADGTEADLLDSPAVVRVDWALEDAVHTHIYPSRADCVRCHNRVAGRVLGLQSAQINGPAAYGDVIENQLTALSSAGLLDLAPDAPDDLLRLPSSPDPAHTLEDRSRGYFHANCAHCHQPGGEMPTIDFRYETPLSPTNICNRLVPGDAVASNIVLRDSLRGAGQMPPIATDLVDVDQLAVTSEWIDAMETCP